MSAGDGHSRMFEPLYYRIFFDYALKLLMSHLCSVLLLFIEKDFSNVSCNVKDPFRYAVFLLQS